jgi:hypothetical protein
MIDSDKSVGTPIHWYDSLNYMGQDAMERDKAQSRRLHQPESLTNSIDPISGNDILDRAGLPHIIEGNLCIYFESEETRQAYMDLPLDHPVRLPDNPMGEGVAEG